MPGARHCLLFDLDGVLIDSWDVARSAFVGACAEIGRDGEELVSGFRDRLGRPILLCVGLLQPFERWLLHMVAIYTQRPQQRP